MIVAMYQASVHRAGGGASALAVSVVMGNEKEITVLCRHAVAQIDMALAVVIDAVFNTGRWQKLRLAILPVYRHQCSARWREFKICFSP